MSLETERHWSLDKRINVSHIIGTVVLASSLFMWAANMESRVAKLEENQINQIQIDDRQDRAIRLSLEGVQQNFNDLRVDLRDIRIRLDRILESNQSGD